MNLYQEDLLEEAKNPSNMGEISDPDLKSTQYNASCGDIVTVFLKFSPDKKSIQDVKWQGQGCVISQASMSLLSEKLKNMAVSEVLTLEQTDLLDLLGFEEIAIGRVKCLMLGLTAVKKMISEN